MTTSVLSGPRAGLKLSMAILGLVGIGISVYLTYIHYRDFSSVCLLNAKCDAVLSSRYAMIWGLPLSLYGLIMYVVLMALSIWTLIAKVEQQDRLDMGIYFMALAGTIFSVYLYYLEIFKIHAFCSWCIMSSIVVLGVLVLSLINLFSGRQAIREKKRRVRFKLSHYIQW